MSEERPKTWSGWWIAGYYAVVMALVAVAIWAVPEAGRFVTGQPLPDPNAEITSTMAGGPVSLGQIPTGWASVWMTAGSALGALVIMIPVAWTYILIKRRTGYEESVVHTLLILPVAVTGIVMVVQGSLALAFSLAGIVAAVRFRTTLDDTKDAVYVFLAIGVGLAAGVQALGIAAALSFVFNVLALVLWRFSFGNVYVDQLRRTGGMSLGGAVAGVDSGKSAYAFGDDRLMTALAPKELREVAEHQARMANYLRQESDRKKERKQYYVLMLYVEGVGDAQAAAEKVLARLCMRWQLAEILPGTGDVSVVEYLVRLREGVSEGELLDGVRQEGGPRIQAAELRSLKTLAKRET
ncbi:MAG: DUF4956 domain-containing protein [Gemmatimonadota bacterium]